MPNPHETPPFTPAEPDNGGIHTPEYTYHAPTNQVTPGQSFEEASSNGDHGVKSEAPEHAIRAERLSSSLGMRAVQEMIPSANWGEVERTTEQVIARDADAARRAVYRAYDNAAFIPAFAGAVAQAQEPSVNVVWPTADQIKEERFDARLVSGVCEIFDFFTGGLFGAAERFDHFIEQQAREQIQRYARPVVRTVQTIGQYSAPRTEFVSQVAAIYGQLVNPREDSDALSPAMRLWDMAKQFEFSHYARYTSEGDSKESQPKRVKRRAETREQYPLVSLLLDSLSSFPPYATTFAARVGIKQASPELLAGIADFLRAQGQEVAPAPGAEPGSWQRRALERFAGKRLELLPDDTAAALQRIYELLPEDGRRFKHEVVALCRSIHDAGQDEDGRSILDKLLGQFKDKFADKLRFGPRHLTREEIDEITRQT